jgi:hypothetical protein
MSGIMRFSGGTGVRSLWHSPQDFYQRHDMFLGVTGLNGFLEQAGEIIKFYILGFT